MNSALLISIEEFFFSTDLDLLILLDVPIDSVETLVLGRLNSFGLAWLLCTVGSSKDIVFAETTIELVGTELFGIL